MPILMPLVVFVLFLIVGFDMGVFGWQRFYDKGGLLGAAQVGLGGLCIVLSITFWIFG